jgi:hypothetical protein
MKTTLPAPQATRTGLLIGGHALAQLGSSRHTDDVDYLINDPTTREMFLHNQAANIDYINANGHKFFAAVWKAEAGNVTGRATPQSLLELKAYAFVQHCLNRKFQKADDAEYDIKFLVRTFGLKQLKIVPKYLAEGELAEVRKVIDSTRI